MASKLFDWREDRARLCACGEVVHLRTKERVQVVDISELVAERVRRSGVGHGVASVQVLQPAAAILVNEHPHTGTLTLNVTEGRLVLGDGQRIFLVDLEGPRSCRVSVVVLGAPRSDPWVSEDACHSR
jgi:thiamine phosphate synthase YjbQ (UPF0047 family)